MKAKFYRQTEIYKKSLIDGITFNLPDGAFISVGDRDFINIFNG